MPYYLCLCLNYQRVFLLYIHRKLRVVKLNLPWQEKTFSPWLYEEVEYMKTLVPKEAKLKIFCKAVTESKGLKVEYEVSELDNFSFLRYDDFLHIRCMTQTL